jgi:hypothetical protein
VAPSAHEITAIYYCRDGSLRLFDDLRLILTAEGRAQREFRGRTDRGEFSPEAFWQLAAVVTDVGFFDLARSYHNPNVFDGDIETVRIQLGAHFEGSYPPIGADLQACCVSWSTCRLRPTKSPGQTMNATTCLEHRDFGHDPAIGAHS